MTEDRSPTFECRDVTVRYGHIVALSDVGAVFERGMIHAVVGQNGAGKTTFARVLAGLVRPASGELKIDGRPLAGGNVKDARRLGIELVHQSFALPPSFTVAEAMQFGAGAGELFTKANLEKRWQPHLDALDVKVKAKQRIRDLPVERSSSSWMSRPRSCLPKALRSSSIGFGASRSVASRSSSSCTRSGKFWRLRIRLRSCAAESSSTGRSPATGLPRIGWPR